MAQNYSNIETEIEGLKDVFMDMNPCGSANEFVDFVEDELSSYDVASATIREIAIKVFGGGKYTSKQNKMNNQQKNKKYMMDIITPASYSELKEALTSRVDGEYNYFCGSVRNGNRYARVDYSYQANNIDIKVTYWEDGESCAVEFASHCSTVRGVATKIAKFLGLK